MRAAGTVLGGLAALAFVHGAAAEDADATLFGYSVPDWLSVHGQSTLVIQTTPPFHAPFAGPESLNADGQTKETIDATLFLGLRVFDGLEAYVNPEIDQGFGLNNTLGLAGFPSGEAYKVGHPYPYARMPRLFARYTLDLGGDSVKVDSDADQVAGTHTADSLVITAGKFSAVDIFDTNTYAHDPRADFLNWSIIDSGAYDYAADSWGYSIGVAAEWTQSWWTLRLGAFNLSTVANGPALETDFSKFELVAEAEERYQLFGQPGKVKLLGFVNRGDFGSYRTAVAVGEATDTTPNTLNVETYRSRPGAVLNIEQGITPYLGAFARISANNGDIETYDFTDIDSSQTAGLSLNGNPWGRADDTIGVAAVFNEISHAARSYFAAGGLGPLIGDGQLPQYAPEEIIEAYYKVTVVKGFALTFDYQHATNPAYDVARGPVNIFALRIHGEF